ncbi:hypothetical protein GCM10020331_085360 [Ectobacillus funiculus]
MKKTTLMVSGLKVTQRSMRMFTIQLQKEVIAQVPHSTKEDIDYAIEVAAKSI